MRQTDTAPTRREVDLQSLPFRKEYLQTLREYTSTLQTALSQLDSGLSLLEGNIRRVEEGGNIR